MNNHMLLPKTDEEGVPYLSYSQLNKWFKSKRDYIRKYMHGEKEDNAGLQRYGDFGHKVGEAFEHNDYSEFEPDEIEFLKTVPRYEEFEREIRLEMDGFYMKGFIDTSTKPEILFGNENSPSGEYVRKIADYKTGEIEKREGEYMDDGYIQVEIYAAGLEQEFGRAPDDCVVILLGRSGNAFKREELKLTKEFVTITREITPERLEEVKKLVQKTAEEISEYYQMYLKINGLM